MFFVRTPAIQIVIVSKPLRRPLSSRLCICRLSASMTSLEGQFQGLCVFTDRSILGSRIDQPNEVFL